MFFIDDKPDYLRLTGRDDTSALVETTRQTAACGPTTCKMRVYERTPAL